MLIIINGGAANFVLQPPRLARLFTKGIADATRDAKAVLMTAGTDAGAAKLVGQAMQAPPGPRFHGLPTDQQPAGLRVRDGFSADPDPDELHAACTAQPWLPRPACIPLVLPTALGPPVHSLAA